MSHFYGTLQGARGRATRCGTATSGMTVQAAGWQGCVEVRVYEQDGEDMFEIWLQPWKGSHGEVRVIARGKLDATVPRAEVPRHAIP